MKNPTVRQCKFITNKLGLDYSEWLVKRWNEIKDGIDICLVHRRTGEKLEMVVDK